MKITIVGGGTAGYVTALILKTRFPDYDIQIIKSDKIGIVGVGEGTTEHWMSFIEYVGIPWKDMIKECDATVKSGIMFDGWGDKPYFHNVNHLAGIKVGEEHIFYLKMISEEVDKFELCDTFFAENKIPLRLDGVDINKNPPTYQYHFNTFKLNEYIHKVAVERGINVIIDDINDTIIEENGNIIKLCGENDNYDSDFYIDCSGFRRQLIGSLGAEWESYSNYLKTNEAIAFPTDDTNEYPLYTEIEAMKYGWMWKTPTNGRWGNGYVYNNEYTNSYDAKKEVEEVLGHEIEVFKKIKFDPGRINKPWINNCVAIGLSASFVEPLEASAISTSIQQTFLLTDYLTNYDENGIIDYNERVENLIENIRDFICLHFITKRSNTEFWKDPVNIPASLQEKLNVWKTRLPVDSDFKDIDIILFKPENFIQVMYGLDLFNIPELKKRYSEYGEDINERLDELLSTIKTDISNAEYIRHKNYLKGICK